MHSPDLRFQSRKVLSQLPETTKELSEDITTDTTLPEWPSRTRRHSPDVIFSTTRALLTLSENARDASR